jgi:spermidine synthase
LIHLDVLQRMHRNLRAARFETAKTLFFPQPIYPTGWWSATIGCKTADQRMFREPVAGAPTFETRYYNEAIHRAAFAEPEFFRQAREAWWK